MQCVRFSLYTALYTVHSVHTHIIKKGEIYQKAKNFDCLGRGDLTSVFFSKVAK